MLAALVLPCSLVLAALLVVMAGARVAQPSRSDAAGALAAGVTTWMITGRGNQTRQRGACWTVSACCHTPQNFPVSLPAVEASG